MSSYVCIDNKNKNILIFGKEPTQGLDNTTLTAKDKHHINFTQSGKTFVLSLPLMEATVSYLLMLQRYINSKQKIQKSNHIYFV